MSFSRSSRCCLPYGKDVKGKVQRVLTSEQCLRACHQNPATHGRPAVRQPIPSCGMLRRCACQVSLEMNTVPARLRAPPPGAWHAQRGALAHGHAAARVQGGGLPLPTPAAPGALLLPLAPRVPDSDDWAPRPSLPLIACTICDVLVRLLQEVFPQWQRQDLASLMPTLEPAGGLCTRCSPFHGCAWC